MIANIGNINIIETHSVKLLGIHIDSELKFDSHVSFICKKDSSKLNTLSRQRAILPFHRPKILIHAFFNSQFSYCPLVWMFHSRELNTKINNLHFRVLRIVYRDETSTFDDLLLRDRSITVHHKNLHTLAIESYKVINGLGPTFMTDIFSTHPNLNSSNLSANTRSQSRFYNTNNLRTANYGSETLRNLGPKVWDILPDDIKADTSLLDFKNRIKKWKPTECPCRLCTIYIPGVVYID